DAARALRQELEGAWEGGQAWKVNEDAVPFLVNLDISRDAARDLISARNGSDWRIVGSGRKSDPKRLAPLELENEAAGIAGDWKPHEVRSKREQMLAAQAAQGPQEPIISETAPSANPIEFRFLRDDRPPAEISPPVEEPPPSEIAHGGLCP